ncbi:nicotinate-nucleotide adenylyltransferase [Paenibacillus sp. NPDC058071]|uniref:nicotinate-nucleotide adenylyltransferase n=1 Tax=Paenibacillus sp. NPDC058071 TaxID=3346326 RepID=UPI0036DD8141
MAAIGIMGGTFDPIHIGHLIAAETALDRSGLEEVWFIPTYMPPLKDGKPGADGELRLQMVEEAIRPHAAFRAVDIELTRGGTSYSVDTATALTSLYPQHTFAYIIGSDRVNDLPSWHRIEELASLVTFIGLEREGTEARLGGLPGYLQEQLTLVAMPPIGVSSTDIRERVRTGRSIRYLVPDAVNELIRRRGLYES